MTQHNVIDIVVWTSYSIISVFEPSLRLFIGNGAYPRHGSSLYLQQPLSRWTDLDNIAVKFYGNKK